MNPLAWLNPGRWLLWFIFACACVLFVRHEYARVDQRGYDRAEATYKAAISAQKAAAAQLLAEETAKNTERERLLRAQLSVRENRDATNAQLVEKLSGDLRAMSRAGGGPGLRDPHAAAPECRCSGGGTEAAAAPGPGNRPADPAQTGGLLSEPLERLLLEITREADAINLAYESCRADAFTIRSPP